MQELFLDANAHVPVNQRALKIFNDFNNSRIAHGHPSSPSIPGRAAANAIEIARDKIASLLGAKANQIIFTSGSSQACEWAMDMLHNIVARSGWFAPWMSPTEHPAIGQAATHYFGTTHQLETNDCGVIKEFNIPETCVICIHVQNEIGIIQPIENIKCDYLLSDMSQSAGRISIDLSRMENVSLATFGGHKFGAPGNVGFIYMKDTDYWTEFGTGSRYFMDRPGTPDTASIVATSIALEDSIATLPTRTENMLSFQTVIEDGLSEMGFEIIGQTAKRMPNTTFVSMPDGRGMSVLLALGNKGIHVGLGSACGSAHTGVSPLMSYLGKGGGSHDYMRISTFGEYGTKEAKLFLDKFKGCI